MVWEEAGEGIHGKNWEWIGMKLHKELAVETGNEIRRNLYRKNWMESLKDRI